MNETKTTPLSALSTDDLVVQYERVFGKTTGLRNRGLLISKLAGKLGVDAQVQTTPDGKLAATSDDAQPVAGAAVAAAAPEAAPVAETQPEVAPDPVVAPDAKVKGGRRRKVPAGEPATTPDLSADDAAASAASVESAAADVAAAPEPESVAEPAPPPPAEPGLKSLDAQDARAEAGRFAAGFIRAGIAGVSASTEYDTETVDSIVTALGSIADMLETSAPVGKATKPAKAKPGKPPKPPKQSATGATKARVAKIDGRDPRLPPPGTPIIRKYGDQTIAAVEQDDGTFLWNGQSFGSLSSVAKAATGKVWNGFLFFALIERKTTGE